MNSEERLARLESEVAELSRGILFLLTQNFGEADPGLNFTYLRGWVRAMLPRLGKRIADEMISERRARISQIVWTGRNADAVRQFVGSRASVVAEGGYLTLVQSGRSLELDVDEILARDPETGRFFRGASADELDWRDDGLRVQRSSGLLTIPNS